jgi:hypothetical protein
VPTYYVSLSVTRPPSLGDLALTILFLEAAQRAGCIAGDVTAAGMIVEAEPVFREPLESSLRDLLREQGATLDSITVRRI